MLDGASLSKLGEAHFFLWSALSRPQLSRPPSAGSRVPLIAWPMAFLSQHAKHAIPLVRAERRRSPASETLFFFLSPCSSISRRARRTADALRSHHPDVWRGGSFYFCSLPPPRRLSDVSPQIRKASNTKIRVVFFSLSLSHPAFGRSQSAAHGSTANSFPPDQTNGVAFGTVHTNPGPSLVISSVSTFTRK